MKLYISNLPLSRTSNCHFYVVAFCLPVFGVGVFSCLVQCLCLAGTLPVYLIWLWIIWHQSRGRHSSPNTFITIQDTMSSATIWEYRADDLGKKVSSQHSHPNTSFELKWNVPSVMLRRGNDPQLTGSVLQGALHNPLRLTIGKGTREAAVESGKGRHLGSIGCSVLFSNKRW